MCCFEFFILALTSTLFSLQFNLNSAQTDGTFLCNIFNSGANYTTNSTFQANLNLLLSSLSNNTNRFYKKTIGRNPDRIYGHFQCRGDFNSQDCYKCVQTGNKQIIDKCPYTRTAVALYDECLLYYSDTSFTLPTQFGPTVSLFNAFNVSNRDQFAPALSELMDGLVAQAVSNTSSFFAVGKNNFTASQKVYGLVQCIPDLSASDCSKCLRSVVSVFPQCCGGRHGARVFKPSCNARYEIYEFFQSQPIMTASVPPWIITAANSSNTDERKMKSFNNIVLIVVAPIIAVLVLSGIVIFFFMRRKKGFEIVNDMNGINIVDSLQFNLATIIAATDSFSDANRLGEGGFGAVYKGKLSDGKEIAVKRLSRHSGQGVKEFKNEVRLLARLQHKNLVRLLGFCLEGQENLLIYEFVLNSSLDKFIFDPIKRTLLDWQSRYKIIEGIVRGLLYLHQDSRARIIHRDLKASNILLDVQTYPKISDFGMARLFVIDQTQGSTSQIVGTYGYMSPEYAMHGHFSVKSDVFSFGVLVLETITGHKNNNFYESDCSEDLLGYVWRKWKDGTVLEVLEPACKESYSRDEVIRCIHIGLLCVQEDIVSRPTMATIDLMLNDYTLSLPWPSEPAFFVKSRFETVPEENLTVNEVSMTELYPR